MNAEDSAPTEESAGGASAGLDKRLAAHPEFGDARAVEQRALARLRVGLAALGREFPSLATVAQPWSDAGDWTLRRLLLDPALRNGFETDLESLLQENGGGESVLADMLAAVEFDADADAGPSAARTEPMREIWADLEPTPVWTRIAEDDSDPVSSRLWSTVRAAFPDNETEAPHEPSADAVAGAERGAQLLAELLPNVGAGVLRHVGIVGFARDGDADGAVQSLSGSDALPGAMFLSPEQTANPWEAAAAILHEALRLRFFEIIRCGDMTAFGADVHEPVNPIPWRARSWSIMRMLSAMHGYVYMTLFQTAAADAGPQLRKRYGDPPPEIVRPATTPGKSGSHDTAMDRAGYLGEQLERVVAHQLSGYGREFASWLNDTLEVLAPGVRDGWTQPPPTAFDDAAQSAAPPPSTRLRAVEPADALALPQQQRLVVAAGQPRSLHWLNLTSWAVYELCDGRDLESLESQYVQNLSEPVSSEDASKVCRSAVARLVREGLVTAADS